MIGIIGGTGLGEALGGLGAGQSTLLTRLLESHRVPSSQPRLTACRWPCFRDHGRAISSARRRFRFAPISLRSKPWVSRISSPARPWAVCANTLPARSRAADQGHRQDVPSAKLILRRHGGPRRDGDAILSDLARLCFPRWARGLPFHLHSRGTYVCMEGPQFSTAPRARCTEPGAAILSV